MMWKEKGLDKVAIYKKVTQQTNIPFCYSGYVFASQNKDTG